MKWNLDSSWEEMKTMPGWNDRCHNFQERSNPVGAYLGGVDDAFHCFIEQFDWKKFYSKARINPAPLFSTTDFIATLKLKEHGEYLAKQHSEESLSFLYWKGVEDTFYIFKFLVKYKHPRLKDGDEVLIHPEMKDQKWAYFKVSISETINAHSSECQYLDEDIPNKKKKKMIYLDELFGWDALAEGHFLTIKKKPSKRMIIEKIQKRMMARNRK